MSIFPSGNFTITNNDTGRCLRVRLGDSKEVNDHKAGATYLLSRTDPPWLTLGPADGSLATAWFFHDAQDGSERRPFNQIANTAVRDLQNIGDYCVWLDSSPERKPSDNLLRFFAKLNDLPDDSEEPLNKLVPAQWHEDRKTSRRTPAGIDEHYDEQLDAELEAWATDQEPLAAKDLERLSAIRAAQRKAVLGEGEHIGPDTFGRLMSLSTPERERLLSEADEAFLDKLEPRAARVRTQAKKLLPEIKKRRAEARDRQVREESFKDWNRACAYLAVLGLNGGHERYSSAMRAYLDAAAKAGISPEPSSAEYYDSNAPTRLGGCGVSRFENSTYRWTTDGTYIFGADSETVPAERTYWTDDNGYLVGKKKGGPGQTWTIATWTPPVRTGEHPLFTGMFGPLGRALKVLGS
ncbi:hypothetical protein ACOZGD_19925 [Streptomyces murinus]